MENDKKVQRYTMPFKSRKLELDYESSNIINKYSLAMYLTALRSFQRRSQEEMAMISGMSIGTISRIETGKNITVENLIRYANILGYDVTLVKHGERVNDLILDTAGDKNDN